MPRRCSTEPKYIDKWRALHEGYPVDEVCTNDRARSAIEHCCDRAGAGLVRLSTSVGTGVQALDDAISGDS